MEILILFLVLLFARLMPRSPLEFARMLLVAPFVVGFATYPYITGGILATLVILTILGHVLERRRMR